MTSCRKYRQQLVFLASEDLNPEEKRRVCAHLQQCASCRAQLQQVQPLVAHAQARGPSAPPQQLLDACRAELRERLRLERLFKGAHPPLEPAKPGWRLVLAAGAAMLMLTVGIAVGRYLLPFRPILPGGSEVTSAEGARVRILDWERQQVEVRLGGVSLSGPASDPRIRPFLVQALAEADNPGQRLRVVKALAAQPLLDEQVEAALISALEKDPNSGVRLQAIRVLRTFPLTAPVRDALIRVLLTDRNPGIRKEAIDALSARPLDPEIRTTLNGIARTDTSAYVRRKAGMALERRENAGLPR